MTYLHALVEANKSMQGVGEDSRKEDIFPCRNKEVFPEEMFELDLKEA